MLGVFHCEDIAVGWKTVAMGRELCVCIVLSKRLLTAGRVSSSSDAPSLGSVLLSYVVFSSLSASIFFPHSLP